MALSTITNGRVNYTTKCRLYAKLFSFVIFVCGYDILFKYTALGIHLYKTSQPNNLNLTFSHRP